MLALSYWTCWHSSIGHISTETLYLGIIVATPTYLDLIGPCDIMGAYKMEPPPYDFSSGRVTTKSTPPVLTPH